METKVNLLKTRLENIETLLRSQTLNNKTVLNIDEVATYTGISKLYLYKLTSKNLIPFYKPNGKNIFFKKDEVDNWLLRNREDTQEEIQAVGENYTALNK